nr:hypothetical protein [uncultured bacterium]
MMLAGVGWFIVTRLAIMVAPNI